MADRESKPLFSEEALNSFSDTDHAIYAEVLRAGSLLAFMQVRELAERAHVSAASVVRFCKKGGYAGFPEFKERFCEDLRSGGVKLDVDELQVLEDFVAHARDEAFRASLDKSFEVLRWARLVVFLGVGTSGYLAAAGSRIFNNAGCFSMYVDDPFMPLVNVPSADTVAVALSFSGTTPQLLSMASDLVRSGCKLISVCNTAENPLSKMADVSIAYQVPAIPVSDRLFLGTQTPVLYVLERLSRMLYEDSGGRLHDTYR